MPPNPISAQAGSLWVKLSFLLWSSFSCSYIKPLCTSLILEVSFFPGTSTTERWEAQCKNQGSAHLSACHRALSRSSYSHSISYQLALTLRMIFLFHVLWLASKLGVNMKFLNCFQGRKFGEILKSDSEHYLFFSRNFCTKIIQK